MYVLRGEAGINPTLVFAVVADNPTGLRIVFPWVLTTKTLAVRQGWPGKGHVQVNPSVVSAPRGWGPYTPLGSWPYFY